MAGPQSDAQRPQPQSRDPDGGTWAAETADLSTMALAACADQCDSFLNETARDYRQLWTALRACQAPDRAVAAWQAFWMARGASYVGAAFRAAAAPIVDVELAARGVAAHRLPD